ncbi:MAG TPA: MFS transporter [Ktedonobacteraceae bacterium]|nr:MFS transporter [Ktedonobacteraceae bacterium]
MSKVQETHDENEFLSVEKNVTPRQRFVPLWRNRDFLLLVSGQAVSSTGSQISLVAFPLLMLALTNSPALAGLMTALRGLPFVLLCLPVGALVDRWDRKRVMILSDAGRAIALGSIPVALALGHLTYVQLALVSLIEGSLFVFFNLAETACIPHVVAKEQLTAATGQNEVLYSLSAMVGPALGPILYGLGSAVPFLADAISYGVSMFSLYFIRAQFQEERSAVASNLWSEIGDGLTWLWHNRLIRFLAVLTLGLTVPCSGYVLILIVLAQHMHASNAAIGLIFACGGIGSIAGSLMASPLQRRFGFGRVMIVTTWIWVLSWLFYALAPNPLLLGLANAVSFIVVPIYMVVQYSYRLATIPDHLQGRVNSVFRLIAFGGQPLGIALTGILLQAYGPAVTVVLMFIPQAILAVAVTFNRHVRHARPISETEII